MAALKFSTAGHGAQCVMVPGILMMPTWCVVSLVSTTHPPRLYGQRTVGVLILSS